MKTNKVHAGMILLGVLACIGSGCIAIRHERIRSSGFDALEANGNTPVAIQAEVASDEFISLLAARTGTAEWRVRRHSPLMRVMNYGSLRFSTGAPTNLLALAERYVGMRQAGHSKAYAFARLGSEPDRAAVPEDCQVILREDSNAYLPALWLFSFEVKSNANHAAYAILDGDLAWSYIVARRNDRTFIGCYTDFFDAKELVPEYRAVFEDVHAQVEKEMRASGDWEQFGSINYYWARKKELLKEKGIQWQSPPDLHPGACYD